MKYIKKIIIVLIMIISTGCTIKYDIEITEDKRINENIEVVEKNEIFKKIGTDNKSYIDMMYDIYNENILYKSYNYKKIIDNNDSGISAKKEYKSFDEYLNHNDIRKTIFRFTNIEEENGIITYSATHLRYEEIFNENETNFPYDTIEITIKLPFEVTETNADTINKEDGKYTWIINKNTKASEIKISFKNKISIDNKIKKYFKNKILPITISASILFLIFIILFINHKRVNKI